MKIPVDFSDVQRGGAIPAGDYNAIVSDVLLKEKTGAEHQYLNWDCVVADGEFEGRHQFMVTSFSPGSKWKMQECFVNLGYVDLNFELEIDDQTGQLTGPEVIGLPCVIQVFQEQYNNRMTSKISTILSVNGENIAAGTPAAAPEQAAEEAAPAAAARPATRAAAAAKPATSNGPARTATARPPFPATAGKRTFK